MYRIGKYHPWLYAPWVPPPSSLTPASLLSQTVYLNLPLNEKTPSHIVKEKHP